jgi:hypothetical protein
MVWGEPGEEGDNKVQGHLGLEEDQKADPQHEGRGEEDEKPHHPAKPWGGQGPEAVVKEAKPHAYPYPKGHLEEVEGCGEGEPQEVVPEEVEGEKQA